VFKVGLNSIVFAGPLGSTRFLQLAVITSTGAAIIPGMSKSTTSSSHCAINIHKQQIRARGLLQAFEEPADRPLLFSLCDDSDFAHICIEVASLHRGD